MNMETLLDILQVLLYVVLGGVAIYFKTSQKAQAKAKEIQTTMANIAAKAVIFIKEAEDTYKDTTNAGGQKFDEVVTRLYALVPDGLNMIITRQMIEEIVQSTFDQIEAYAKTQLDKVIDSTEVKE